MCGERIRHGREISARFGSSPRVWGTAECQPGVDIQRRFIPTCVGNGPPGDPAPAVPGVHPHVCGERPRSTCVMINLTGSSPRVWGTGAVSLTDRAVSRFIPTCVGNGVSPGEAVGARAVHPHVCGERWPWRWCLGDRPGSSPRVWGTVPGQLFGTAQPRFIPTCVGNGCELSEIIEMLAVHPHVCGERIK